MFCFTRAVGVSALALVVALPGETRAKVEPAAAKRQTWKVGGVEREAVIYAPDAAKVTATPVVFGFHGHGGSAKVVAARFAFQRHWPDAISVYPQGLPTATANDPEGKRPGWQNTRGTHDDRDLKFLDRVLESLRAEYKVDEKRVYATGHSNGGGFVYLLWAERGDTFAALAPSASFGAVRREKQLRPKPILHIAGEQDPIFDRQKAAMDVVRRVNACSNEGTEWAKNCLQYPSSRSAPFVSMIYPGGHSFPDEAPELIVRFFREHPR